MKPRIRLRFTDFPLKINLRDNFFTQLLSEHYDVQICDDPDYLIYSCFGKEFRKHRGIRIYYTAENRRPNFQECDYAFTFDFCDHPNHMRFPYWRLCSLKNPLPARLTADPLAVLRSKTCFCNFVCSNWRCLTRNRFFPAPVQIQISRCGWQTIQQYWQ